MNIKLNSRINLLLILCLIIGTTLFAKSIKVTNISQYKEAVKTLVAGDSVVLANGIWKDAELVFKGTGNKEKNIYLTAETPGKVTMEGQSCLRLSGEYLHVSGLVFQNGYSPRGNVIEFRTSSKDYAYNSTVTECVIDKFNKPMKDSSDHWIGLYGKKNTVEYCYLAGKTNEGPTLVVWPNDENSINNGHLIFRNYFGHRPRLGSNGGETIRIGTSHVCMNSSRTIVDGNYFERCNGETEIISNKSCDNIFVNNTFFESEGSLVMRHGDRGIVAGNWFIGNGKIFTGGVRVINEGHQIYNNYFYKLRGDDFRSPLAVMNGIPNSELNGYMQVKNVVVANNTYFDCSTPWAFGVGFGERNRNAKPEGTLLLNNLIYSPNENELIKYYDQSEGIRFDNNIMVSNKGVLTVNGGVQAEVFHSEIFGIEMVYSKIRAKKLPYVKFDILGQTRGESVIGAFQNSGEKSEIQIATSKNCGPEWYKIIVEKEVQKPKVEGKTIQVAAGIDNLTKALKKANENDVFILSEGEHVITNKIAIVKNITVRGADSKSKPVIKLQSSRAHNSFFEIGASAVVRFDGLVFDGDKKAAFPAKYIFISAKEGAFNYSLHVNNCELFDINVETGAIFKAYKGSIADSLVFKNSVLRNSFRALSLGDEKDDIGKYNAENIILDNTVFSNITQYAIDFYRGGNDESTLGGSLKIDHCVFDNIGVDDKQTILKLTNIVNVKISNSIFNNCLAKTSVKLSGLKNSINSCTFSGSANPKVEKGAQSINILFESPKFEKKSFVLSGKSKLIGKATDGGNIGLK